MTASRRYQSTRLGIAGLALIAASAATLASLSHRSSPEPGNCNLETVRADYNRQRPGSPDANVLLITWEATRADHVGAYGYQRDTTPEFDRFAKQGALFSNYYVMVPRTTPSTVSIMSSLHPTTSGVRSNRDTLDGRYLTLAEILSKYGYRTASTMADSRRGMVQGMQDPIAHDGAKSTRKDAIRWLRKLGGQKFFLWLHYREEAHRPYAPPPPFDAVFGSSDAREAVRELQLKVRRRKISLQQFYVEIDHPENVKQEMTRLYDGEIRYADDETGKLLAELDRLGLRQNTIVIWSADHGEGLCDHGVCWEHGELAYDDGLHVPLAIVFPPLIDPGTVIRHPSQALDIAPTVLEMLGLPVHQEMEGCSLLPVMRGDREEDPERLLYLESAAALWSGDRFRHLPGNRGKWRVVRNQRWKLILIPKPGGAVLELYDIEEDPGETRNLADRERKVAEYLASKLRSWMARTERADRASSTRVVDEELEAELRSLGYIE